MLPLDSIRNENGQYPANTYEVVYPGVHSDVGGGYPENDQGKARGGTNELMSQIVLHDLYAAAFAAGAPLQVPEEVLPKTLLTQKLWRVMSPMTDREFGLSDELVERFNAWRSKTLQVIETEESINGLAWEYKPPRLSTTVEDTLADQLGWITGWRIGRYVNDLKDDNDSYKRQPYFTQAKEVTAYIASEERKDYEKEVAGLPRKRLENPNLPGRGSTNRQSTRPSSARPPRNSRVITWTPSVNRLIGKAPFLMWCCAMRFTCSTKMMRAKTTQPSGPRASGAVSNCSVTLKARLARIRTWPCWCRCSMTRYTTLVPGSCTMR